LLLYLPHKLNEMFIYQQADWPNFTWDTSNLMNLVSEVRNLQGIMVGKLSSLGFETKDSATIEAMSLEIVKSNAIEGEKLNREDVRSSVARKLGIEWPAGKMG
jgi:Fic family protein